jgi:transposase
MDLIVEICFRLCEETEDERSVWLTDEQMERLQPLVSTNHGKPLVDDRHVLNRNGLRWRDAPREDVPHKAL